jgi:hypothetical protein
MRGKNGGASEQEKRGSCDTSLQSHSGANLNPKGAKNRGNMLKGGEANEIALTPLYTGTRTASAAHRRGGMSGDNPFSASSAFSTPNSAPNSGPYSGDSSAGSKLRSASVSLPQFRSRNSFGSEASRLVHGIKVLVSTERWPWLRSKVYIVRAH